VQHVLVFFSRLIGLILTVIFLTTHCCLLQILGNSSTVNLYQSYAAAVSEPVSQLKRLELTELAVEEEREGAYGYENYHNPDHTY
jgi:hypothetical protein